MWVSRDGYRDQIVTISVEIGVTECDVGVSLHSKTHPCTVHVCSTLMAHACTLMHTSIEACFLCFFYNPLYTCPS